jgi:hypothetical protein
MSKNIIAILGMIILILGGISYLMYTENNDLKDEERDSLKTEMATMIPVSEKNALKLVNAFIWDNGQKIADTKSFSFHPYSATYKIKDNGSVYEIEVLRGIGNLEGNNLTVSYHALKFEVNKNTGEVVYKGMAEASFPNTVYVRVS